MARRAGVISFSSRSLIRSHTASICSLSDGFRYLPLSLCQEPGGSSDLSTAGRSSSDHMLLYLAHIQRARSALSSQVSPAGGCGPISAGLERAPGSERPTGSVRSANSVSARRSVESSARLGSSASGRPGRLASSAGACGRSGERSEGSTGGLSAVFPWLASDGACGSFSVGLAGLEWAPGSDRPDGSVRSSGPVMARRVVQASSRLRGSICSRRDSLRWSAGESGRSAGWSGCSRAGTSGVLAWSAGWSAGLAGGSSASSEWSAATGPHSEHRRAKRRKRHDR